MITQSNACPDCTRVLFPTREHAWPWHYTTNTRLRDWCPRSGTPITARARNGAMQ